MSGPENRELPAKDDADVAFAIAETVASLVPGVSQLLRLIMDAPVEQRRDEWLRQLGQDVASLMARKGVDIETLQQTPTFIDAVSTATQIALRTSQTEKRRALRNAVLNSAISDLDVSIQQIFLSWIDRATDRHLILLQLVQNPAKWLLARDRTVRPRAKATEVLEDAFPDATSNYAFYELLWSDLFAAGFVKMQRLDNGLEGDATKIQRTTPFGDQFLEFITSPVD